MVEAGYPLTDNSHKAPRSPPPVPPSFLQANNRDLGLVSQKEYLLRVGHIKYNTFVQFELCNRCSDIVTLVCTVEDTVEVGSLHTP